MDGCPLWPIHSTDIIHIIKSIRFYEFEDRNILPKIQMKSRREVKVEKGKRR